MKIQASTIGKLKTPLSGFDRYWDDEVKGFGIRVYSTGSITYIFRYRNSVGKEKQFTIGKNLAPAQAKKMALKLRGETTLGNDPVEQKKEDYVKRATFHQLVEKYKEEELPKLTRRTQVDYLRHLTNISKTLGQREISNISEEDIRKIQDSYKKEVGERTSNVVITLMKRVFSLSQSVWKLSDQNPCVNVKKFKEVPRTERLSQTEIEKLNASIEKEQNPYVSAYFKILMRTGCRMGELQLMKWEDIKLSQGEWLKPTTKIGEPHLIPLTETCVEIIRSLDRLPNNEYVFCGKVKGKPLNSFRKMWLRIAKRAGIENVHMHDMRRTIGYLLLKNGVAMERVSQILGHKSIRTTERVYAGLDMEEKRKTVDLLDGLIGR